MESLRWAVGAAQNVAATYGLATSPAGGGAAAPPDQEQQGGADPVSSPTRGRSGVAYPPSSSAGPPGAYPAPGPPAAPAYRVLISVHDKEGVIELAKSLLQLRLDR